jgi:hypothetical protein
MIFLSSSGCYEKPRASVSSNVSLHLTADARRLASLANIDSPAAELGR